MAEQPALNRFYVASYAANDKDFPILAVRLDPRVAGYRVPEDLSPHPDSKRYPNHIFTGSQPSNGDERVTHVYEILPDPYVPFTRYDDDLGPIQGRRRSVKNEGQVARLGPNQRVNYEAREGSAIVYTEIEEEWSIETDEDGNSLFPIKDRDFYEPSRGAVQERRQLFVPTGDEEGTLENINGVITQTSYEPYNEFLSVKIVQTYKVDGPQLVGRATDNDGQLVTVTTQRKGSDGYIPPNPTATRTVEVNREDAESLVERIVDTPEVFTAKTFSLERPDPIPQKFRVAVPLQSEQEVVEGQAGLPTLSEGEISRTEEQRNKFIKRTTATSRDQTVLPKTLVQKSTDNDRQTVTITETLQLGDTSEVPTATTTVSSEALGDGNFVVTKTQVPEVFAGKVFQKTKDDLTPQKFRGAQESNTIEESFAGTAVPPTLLAGQFAKSEQQVNRFVKRVSTTSRAINQSVTLLESILTQEGQIGLRTLTMSSAVQTFTPSATLIDASIESLGDGRTIKTEVTIPSIFKGRTFSIERPDIVPEKFRSSIPSLTNEESVEGEATTPTLLSGEIAKSEQQVTNFIKRVRSTKRDISFTRTVEGLQFTNDLGGGYAEIKETYPFFGTAPSVPDLGTLADQVEDLGDGTVYRRQIKLKTNSGDIVTNLRGQDYDQELDIVIPYRQIFADASSPVAQGPRKNVSPRDVRHSQVIQYDIEEAQDALDDYYWEIPEMTDVELPNKLIKVVLLAGASSSSGSGSGSGSTYSYSFSRRGGVSGSIAYDIEQGFRGTIPTIRSVFFLPKENASPDDVLIKINQKRGNVLFWPNVRPESHFITITEQSFFQEESASVSFDSQSESSSSGGTFEKEAIVIPPTIHEELTILTEGVFGNSGIVSLNPRVLQKTKDPKFPTGEFLYGISATPYKFSYVRVDALIVKITEEYV